MSRDTGHSGDDRKITESGVYIMELDQDDLKRGLQFIVGTWQVDYLVNAWSNDLAHIPATEFKSEDGTDFTAIQFEFFEDHSVVMKDTSKGKEVKGTWEQTGWSEFHYTLNDFLEIPDSTFKKNAETLQMIEGTHLVFGIGILSVAMKKIAEGTITKEADIGDIEMSDEDAARMDIVGEYETVKAFSFVDGKMDLFTKEQVKADIDKKVAAGEMDEHDAAQSMMAFDSITEITESHKIKIWMKVPAGVTEDKINAALEAGEIEDYDGERFCAHTKPWKCVDGKFYYDTGEQREVFGEMKSSWDEIKYDEDGTMIFSSGLARLKKID